MSYILTIGSCILDIVATYDEEQSKYIDKIGNVRFSVGGIAYNISSYLRSLQYETKLFTYIKKDSFSYILISNRLTETSE